MLVPSGDITDRILPKVGLARPMWDGSATTGPGAGATLLASVTGRALRISASA